jgi:hypothetical protein
VASAEEYPGGSHRAEHLLDGREATEFSSNAKGTQTFIEFDFGAPVEIAAVRHQDRNDPATIAASELIFLDPDDPTRPPLRTVPVRHVNRRAGVTFVPLAGERVASRRVRWRVTALGSHYSTVGGAEIVFFRAGQEESLPRGLTLEAQAVPVVRREGSRLVQPWKVTVDYPYANGASGLLKVPGQAARPIQLELGRRTLDFTLPALEAEQTSEVLVEIAGETVARQMVKLKPARKTTIYILPHSHTDIGYTEIQTEIEDKQVNNLLLGLEYARKTADYPPGARFVWNVEVLWAADLYLRRLGEPQRQAFLDGLKQGQIALCGMYLNELTGLCRPEELMRLFHFATQLREQTGTTIDTAMISDVPGYTWGTVTAMAHAGIKYFSVAPNYFDRIGDILVQWENKPFYWLGPSAKDRVLVWIPYKGYAMSHVHHALTADFVEQYQAQLDKSGYPYDVAYMRWAGHGDNATPDPAICEFVREWSRTHAWPRFVIASASEAFQAFEARYGSQLPQVRGDWTPYWEDGAGSSALETGMNRASSDRLSQAEAVWAIQQPRTYPVADFQEAWRNVLLYSEHTWGAWCSVSEPARRETREQWAVKQSYAATADRQSRDLLSRALGQEQHSGDRSEIDVFNTSSWPRSDLVVVPKYLSEGRHRVLSRQGQPLPSQRLRSGELVFMTPELPAFAAERFTLQEGSIHAEGRVTAQGNTLDNGLLHIRLDERTGGIVELRRHGLDANLVDTASGHALNDYLYLIGDDVTQGQRNGAVRITVKETGPLVASLVVESDAPGCFRLEREVRLVAGLDYVELINLVDKQRLAASSYHAKEGKESVNFAFPFSVPEGQVRLEVPFGVLRPEVDQIPSACKNWFTVGRWADVANDDYGVTWITLDAPLVQVGGITANLLNSQTNPDLWRKQVGPTQKLYAWAMNNHWGTNYRAYQEGPVVFRFVMRPHRGYDPAAAARLAIGLSQPLLPTGARGNSARSGPRVTVASPAALATALKPSEDGKALILRLWAAGDQAVTTQVTWSDPSPRRVSLSDISEKALEPAGPSVTIPAWGVVSLRADLE